MLKKIFFTTLLISAMSVIGFAQNTPETKTTTTKTTTTKTTVTPATTTKTTATPATIQLPPTTIKTAPATTTTKVVTATTVKTAPQTPDQKAVRATFDKLVEGIQKSDVDLVMSVYQDSSATLYFNNNGSITRGYEQDKANREARYPKITNALLTPTNVRVDMLGAGGALLTCQWTQTQDYEGKPEVATGRMTLVFKKIGGSWKVIHLHTSPDKPDTTRPILSSERIENQ